MSNRDDDFDDFSDFDDTLYDGLSELEKDEKNRYLLQMAFNNSYDILTNKITFSELLDITQNSKEGYTALAHDIDQGVSKQDINNMILYFQEKEEYEKCAVLHKMLIE
jgi:hypothetical protein